MPEWPEVTLTTRALQNLCVGMEIQKVEIIRNLKHNVVCFDAITDQLPLTIESIYNVGKNIVFALTDNRVILSHMMLTGSWITSPSPFTCVVLHFDTFKLYYKDSRRFGRLDFCSETEADCYLSKVKPDIMQLTKEEFCTAIRKKKRAMIYNVILDQNTVLSGVGNYIAAESLYRAEIHPRSLVQNIPKEKLECLYEGIKTVCEESLEKGGVSISDYVSLNGKPGRYQNYLKVYKQSSYKVKMGSRNCYYNPEVQKL